LPIMSAPRIYDTVDDPSDQSNFHEQNTKPGCNGPGIQDGFFGCLEDWAKGVRKLVK
jgi:hypothetical protein